MLPARSFWKLRVLYIGFAERLSFWNLWISFSARAAWYAVTTGQHMYAVL
jgi:hypothetical protein